jgi:hypothetical protein
MEEDESGYMFKEGHIINFQEINENNIKFGRKTGALRVRTTDSEIYVDFIEEMKPTKEQLDTIKKLKTEDKKLFFEIVDKNNNHIKGYGGYDKTLEEMEKQLKDFYNKKK